MKKFNLNSYVKVKLSPEGIETYYHQFDDLIERGFHGIKRIMPEIDKDGFTKFQLWRLMELYGSNIFPNTSFEEIYIYIDENDLEEV